MLRSAPLHSAPLITLEFSNSPTIPRIDWTMKRCVPACSGFLLACFLAFLFQIFFFSPISPDLLLLPTPSSNFLPTNNKLQANTKELYINL